MKVYNKVLSEKNLINIFSLLKDTISNGKNKWLNSYWWAEKIVRKSNPVNILPIENSKLKNNITKDLIKLNEFKKVNFKKIIYYIYIWDRGSYIPFHSDEGNKLAATIYLNDIWNKDDGGIFLYEEENQIKGILPEYNKIVINNNFLNHTVTMIVPTAEHPRVTLQIFEK
jgi:hypothetical protein